MRIVVPYVEGMIHDETIEALNRSTFHYELVKLPLLDEYAYGRAFQEWWSDGRAFCIVEHDMVPSWEQLAALARCPELRCAVPYAYMGKVIDQGLGCTRFSQELIRDHPYAADQSVVCGTRPQRKAKWNQIDMGIYSYLKIVGVPIHRHDEVGLCEHLHTWPELEGIAHSA